MHNCNLLKIDIYATINLIFTFLCKNNINDNFIFIINDKDEFNNKNNDIF
jgi:hypothetical protein